MNDRFTSLRVFQRVAYRTSISRAARDLGLSQPSVSRIVRELEQDLGAALFARTTRSLTLTEHGADYLQRVEPILQALEEADHAARGGGVLRGRLRVALSSSLGVREIIPRLPGFLAKHPALHVDLTISDERHDLVMDGVDVAMRAAPMRDSTSLARKLAESPRVLAASPAYLAKAGKPRTPEDLSKHAMIIGPGALGAALTFVKKGRRVSPVVDGRLTVTTNEGATAAAVADMGITVSSLWGCRAEIERGALVRVLAHWTLPPVALHAVFPPGRAPSPAARALVDHLAAQI